MNPTARRQLRVTAAEHWMTGAKVKSTVEEVVTVAVLLLTDGDRRNRARVDVALRIRRCSAGDVAARAAGAVLRDGQHRGVSGVLQLPSARRICADVDDQGGEAHQEDHRERHDDGDRTPCRPSAAAFHRPCSGERLSLEQKVEKAGRRFQWVVR